MWPHGGADAVQMVTSGPLSGVSSVPARITTRCGRASVSLVRGVAHTGQKACARARPLAEIGWSVAEGSRQA